MPGFLRSLANCVFARVDAPAARTTTGVGTAFDTIDYDGTLKFVMDVSSVTGTTPTCDFKIQNSDTSGGTYTDVVGATATQITASGVREINIDVAATKRFLKLAFTIGGTTPSFTVVNGAVGAKKYQ